MRRGHRLTRHSYRRREDLLGIVFDVARRWIVLRDLAVAAAAHPGGLVEDERGGSGGALIEREDEAHGSRVLKRRIGSISAR